MISTVYKYEKTIIPLNFKDIKMKKTFSKTAVALSAALMISSVAVADDSKYGVGISLDTQRTATIRGTINVDDDMRFEPFVAFGYSDKNFGGSSTDFSIGTGFHWMKPINSNITAYYGGYVGYFDYTTSVFALGPVAGVEYAFDPQFTLGAEVSFDFAFGDNNIFGTNSEVLLRYYF